MRAVGACQKALGSFSARRSARAVAGRSLGGETVAVRVGQTQRTAHQDSGLGRLPVRIGGVRGRDHGGQAPKGMWGMPQAPGGVKGRGRLRKARGSCQTSVDPGIPEQTRRTETSKYPQERKATATSPVAASEKEDSLNRWASAQRGRGATTAELQNDRPAESDGKRNRSG